MQPLHVCVHCGAPLHRLFSPLGAGIRSAVCHLDRLPSTSGEAPPPPPSCDLHSVAVQTWHPAADPYLEGVPSLAFFDCFLLSLAAWRHVLFNAGATPAAPRPPRALPLLFAFLALLCSHAVLRLYCDAEAALGAAEHRPRLPLLELGGPCEALFSCDGGGGAAQPYAVDLLRRAERLPGAAPWQSPPPLPGAAALGGGDDCLSHLDARLEANPLDSISELPELPWRLAIAARDVVARIAVLVAVVGGGAAACCKCRGGYRGPALAAPLLLALLLPGAVLGAALVAVAGTWPGFSGAGLALAFSGGEVAGLCASVAAALGVAPWQAAALVGPSWFLAFLVARTERGGLF